MHRILTFSLRTLMVLLAVGSAWLAMRVHSIRTIEVAAAEIETKSVGLLVRRLNVNDDPMQRSFVMKVLLGQRPRDKIRGVWIRECDRVRFRPDSPPYTDALVLPLVPHMRKLPDLREVRLEGSPISSETVIALTTINSLEILDLSDTRVDDTAIGGILRLTKLQELDVTKTSISEKGLATLLEQLPRSCTLHADSL